MEIKKEVLDELIRGYEKPEDLIGETGLLKQLTKALIEDAQRPSLPRLSGLRYVNAAHQRCSVLPAPQFLFNLFQEPIFAVVADGVDIHLVHSRRPFVGLYPLPGFLQDVLPTDLIVEKREPPFRLLLGHSV